jgi:hypothetical protein
VEAFHKHENATTHLAAVRLSHVPFTKQRRGKCLCHASSEEMPMHVEFKIEGRYCVPEGTSPLEGVANQFRLPTGQIISVYPVIEMASSTDSDDHRDLNWSECASLGISLDLYDRQSELEPDD